MTDKALNPQRLLRIKDWMQSYVDSGRFPGACVSVLHGDHDPFEHTCGYASVEDQSLWQIDTQVRIYSMTKPVASLGLMLLFEKALFHLDQPIGDFLPELAELKVLRAGATSLDDTEPATASPTIHQLLTHTAGFSYDFNQDLVASAYQDHSIQFAPDAGGLEAIITRLADIPLLHTPGTRWHYSIATDVIGRLIEVLSGQSLADYLRQEIFEPLGMRNTRFYITDEDVPLTASLYAAKDGGMRLVESSIDSRYRQAGVDTWSAGGGLLSNVHDYQRFAQLLLRGGRIGNDHLIAPHTLRMMMGNHLPGDIASMGPATFSETPFDGIGFGLGGWVVLNPLAARLSASPGDFGWGGMASTVFWVDPVEDITCVFLTQLMPSSTWPNRRELRALVYQALL